MAQAILHDESGFIVSAEITLIFTLVFCGVAVGTAVIRDSLVQEFGDVAEAIGALNQSYRFTTISAPVTNGDVTSHASCTGSGFTDLADDCDCDPILFTIVTPQVDPQGNGLSGNGGDGRNIN